MQGDAHVPQLLDGQQGGDDVLTEPVVNQNLRENTDRVSAPQEEQNRARDRTGVNRPSEDVPLPSIRARPHCSSKEGC